MDLRQSYKHGKLAETYLSNAIVNQIGHKIVSRLTSVYAPPSPKQYLGHIIKLLLCPQNHTTSMEKIG